MLRRRMAPETHGSRRLSEPRSAGGCARRIRLAATFLPPGGDGRRHGTHVNCGHPDSSPPRQDVDMGARSVGQDTLIAAPAESVWAVISNVERTGEWSPECIRCRWLDGATRATVGARYQGVSRNGWRRWSTISRITQAQPGVELEWEGTYLGRPVARWRYRLTTVGDGRTRLEEWAEDRRERWLRIVSPWLTGSRDRADRNSSTIGTSLSRIKAIVESEHERLRPPDE